MFSDTVSSAPPQITFFRRLCLQCCAFTMKAVRRNGSSNFPKGLWAEVPLGPKVGPMRKLKQRFKLVYSFNGIYWAGAEPE